MERKLILASGSPRRQALLCQMGLSFDVRPTEADETLAGTETPEEAVRELARRKAAAALISAPDDIILAADTVVCCGGAILGKPGDAADARRMLRLLSGREHTVCTGLCLRQGERELVRDVSTRVRFITLDDAQIDAYIATGEPFDKAGGYGIQARGALFVEAVSGDYYNVVGLPVCTLGRLLREEFGFLLP